MKYFALRGGISTALFTIGLWVARSSIESNGMAGPRNAAWRLIDGILSVEWEIIKGIGWIALVLGGALILGIGLDLLVFDPIRQRRAEEKWRAKQAEERRQIEESCAIWEAKRAAEEVEREKERKAAHERWLEKKAIEAALIRTRSKREVENDALDDLTKGG